MADRTLKLGVLRLRLDDYGTLCANLYPARGVSVFTMAKSTECRLSLNNDQISLWVGNTAFRLTRANAYKVARTFPELRCVGWMVEVLKPTKRERAKRMAPKVRLVYGYPAAAEVQAEFENVSTALDYDNDCAP